MKYLRTANAQDRRYCVASGGHLPYWTDIACGHEALPRMREHGDEVATLRLQEAQGGLGLPDFVSNVHDLLILRRSCAEAILHAHDPGPYELIPAVLVDAKGRAHAEDYVILNPLGRVDCLDVQRSQMAGPPEHPWVRAGGSFFLDRIRVPLDRDIFRIEMLPAGYAVSDRLAAFIDERAFTNFVLIEVPDALSEGHDQPRRAR